jgi:hypothetical protein
MLLGVGSAKRAANASRIVSIIVCSACGEGMVSDCLSSEGRAAKNRTYGLSVSGFYSLEAP